MSFITPSEFSGLMAAFEPFEISPILLVATSGGPDSLALTLLAHQWAFHRGGKAIAVTVDHQLRKGSTIEAHQVKDWLNVRGIEHHILTWERKKNEKLYTSIQAVARKARYQMLGQWCKDRSIKHLLTAHHAQDQLETFMIRLAKGSGLKGLTGTQEIVPTNYGRILRPFLTIDASRLKTTLKHFNQSFLLDPSNENKDFTRVRWRQLLPLLAQEGLTWHSLQESLERLNHSQRLIDQHISKLIQRHVTLNPYGYAIISQDAFGESFEALEEILKRILSTIGTKSYPVRRQALHRSIDRLKAGHSITLGGCQILHKCHTLWVVRELAAVGKDITVSEPGTYLWDNHFAIEVLQELPCRISALGEIGVRKMGKALRKELNNIPHVVLKALPALWREDTLLKALPSFRYIPSSLPQYGT